MNSYLILFGVLLTVLPALGQIPQSGLLADFPMTNCDGTAIVGTILPDCSGHSNNASLSGTASTSTAGVVFSRAKSTYALLPPALSFQTGTIIVFADYNRYAQAGQQSTILASTAPATSNGLHVYIGTDANGTNTQPLVQAGAFGPMYGYFNLKDPSMLTVVLDPTNSRLMMNDFEPLYQGFYVQSGFGTKATTFQGQLQLAPGYNGTIYHVLFYSTALSKAQIVQIYQTLNTQVAARGVNVNRTSTSQTNSVVIQGTSIEIYGSPSWPLGMKSLLSDNFEIHTDAQSGQVYANIISYTAALDNPLVNPGAKRNVAIAGAPTNDVAAGSTLSQSLSAYAAVVQSLRAGGFTEVYCPTILSRQGSAAGVTVETLRNAWNSLLATSYKGIGCDGIIDFAADSRLGAIGAYANTAYFSDGVHPTQAGFTLMSQIAAKALNGTPPTTAPVPNVGLQVNAQTSSYTVQSKDHAITMASAAATTITLPQPGANSIPSGWSAVVQNIGPASATLKATNSLIDGGGSITLTAGQQVLVFSDGTNYSTLRSVAATPTAIAGLQTAVFNQRMFGTNPNGGYYAMANVESGTPVSQAAGWDIGSTDASALSFDAYLPYTFTSASLVIFWSGYYQNNGNVRMLASVACSGTGEGDPITNYVNQPTNTAVNSSATVWTQQRFTINNLALPAGGCADKVIRVKLSRDQSVPGNDLGRILVWRSALMYSY